MFIDPNPTKQGVSQKMKTNLTRQREEVFTILRASLSRLNLPVDLVEELIERHIAVAFEKGTLAFREGNTDQFRKDKQPLRIHNVSKAEMKMLSQVVGCNFAGIRSPRDLIFMLNTIRHVVGR